MSNKAGLATQIKCVILGYCIFLTSFTLIKAMGIFFIQFQLEFNASAAQASFTVSLPSIAVFMGGPAYGAAFNSFGIKPTYATAGFLMFLGFSGCFFATSLLYCQIFLALFVGTGAGLANVATLTLLGRAFYSSRPVALGALAMGGSTSAAISGPVLQWCIDSFTWRGAILLLGAYCLHSTAFGFAIDPVYTKIVKKRQLALMLRAITLSGSDENLNKDGSVISSSAKDSERGFGNTVEHSSAEGENPESMLWNPKNGECVQRKSRSASLGASFAAAFDMSLLKDPWFVIFCISCGLSISSRLLSGLYLVRYAQAAGISNQNAAMKLTVCESVAFVVTPLVGLITSVKRQTSRREESKVVLLLRRFFSSVRRSFVLSFFQILMFIVLFISTKFTTNEEFNIYAAMLGFCYGGTTFMTNVVLADLFGTKKLAGALGYRSFATAILLLPSPYLIGHLIDVTGTYIVSQYFTGIMTLLAGILTALTQIALLCKEKSENNESNNNNSI